MLISLRDLDTWKRELPSLAVLGFPVQHSLSPPMHNAALAAMDGRFGDWQYYALEIPVEEMAAALPLLHSRGFYGLNLTIPHKVDVIPMLEEVDPPAARMGAVNTLVRTESGYRGFNTDGYGIRKAIAEKLNRSLEGADILLLGAGGAARAIAVECLQSGCQRLTLANRNIDRMEMLSARLAEIPDFCSRVRHFPLASLPEDWEGSLIIINATSLGLKAEDPAPLALQNMPGSSVVYDTTYGSINQLRKESQLCGIPYADGLSMLVWQGVRSLEIWSGETVPQPVMAKAARQALEAKLS
jgi:shikimate dehydrogenase